MLDVMYDVHRRCPEITKIYNLSEKTNQNRSLTVIEITDNPGVHEIGKNISIISVFIYFVLIFIAVLKVISMRGVSLFSYDILDGFKAAVTFPI